MPNVVKLLWPIWLGILFQFLLNIIMAFYVGDYHSTVASWLFSRRCNYGFCDGAVLIAVVWGLVGVGFIVNVVRLVRSR